MLASIFHENGLLQLPSRYANDVTVYSCNRFIYNFAALLPQDTRLEN